MLDVYLPADSQRHLIQIGRENSENFARVRFCRRAQSGDPCLDAANYGAFVILVKEEENLLGTDLRQDGATEKRGRWPDTMVCRFSALIIEEEG
jgi:hypothetical protein